eukprot:406732_1
MMNGVDVTIYLTAHKVLMNTSASYFILQSVYDCFVVPDHAQGYRLIMVVHHVFSFFAIMVSFLGNEKVIYLQVVGLQCEFSTVFMNLRFFARVFSQEEIFFMSGLCTMITYPLTRVIGGVCSLYEDIRLKQWLILLGGNQLFWWFSFVSFFVIIMSTVYTGHMLR